MKSSWTTSMAIRQGLHKATPLTPIGWSSSVRITATIKFSFALLLTLTDQFSGVMIPERVAVPVRKDLQRVGLGQGLG